jgi:hypothetical protein
VEVCAREHAKGDTSIMIGSAFVTCGFVLHFKILRKNYDEICMQGSPGRILLMHKNKTQKVGPIDATRLSESLAVKKYYDFFGRDGGRWLRNIRIRHEADHVTCQLLYRQPVLLCTPRNFATKFNIFRKKYFWY